STAVASVDAPIGHASAVLESDDESGAATRARLCPAFPASPGGSRSRQNGGVGTVLDIVSADIARRELIAPGTRVTCLVSGGADSTCLWHVLGRLGYEVEAVHVHHGIRG